MDRAETGRRGERAAARYYIRQGCTLLAHNYAIRQGELDLVLKDPEAPSSSARSRPAPTPGGLPARPVGDQSQAAADHPDGCLLSAADRPERMPGPVRCG